MGVLHEAVGQGCAANNVASPGRTAAGVASSLASKMRLLNTAFEKVGLEHWGPESDSTRVLLAHRMASQNDIAVRDEHTAAMEDIVRVCMDESGEHLKEMNAEQ